MDAGRPHFGGEYLSSRRPKPLDFASGERSEQCTGTPAIWKIVCADGSIDRMVRLDHHRFSSCIAFGRHERMDAVRRWNTSGYASRNYRETATREGTRSYRA